MRGGTASGGDYRDVAAIDAVAVAGGGGHVDNFGRGVGVGDQQ